jgi:hypothetical protein
MNNFDNLKKWLGGLFAAGVLLLAALALAVVFTPTGTALARSSGALDVVQAYLVAFWADAKTRAITAQVLLHAVLGVVVASRAGEFRLSRLPDFLRRWLVPELAVYFAVRLLGEAAGFGGLDVAIFGLIQLKIIGASLEKLNALGLPVPDSLLSVSRLGVR